MTVVWCKNTIIESLACPSSPLKEYRIAPAHPLDISRNSRHCDRNTTSFLFPARRAPSAFSFYPPPDILVKAKWESGLSAPVPIVPISSIAGRHDLGPAEGAGGRSLRGVRGV